MQPSVTLRYDTVLLDLDHTLFDSDFSERAAFERTLSAADVAVSAPLYERYQTINLELWAAVERGELLPDRVKLQRFERLVDSTRLKADPNRMAEDFVAGLAETGELYPGAREIIECLRDRVRLGLITNGLSEVQRTRLARLDIAQHFDTITISAEVGASKPSAEIFDAAFAALGHPPRETALMVGDNLISDIGGAADYGLATCWYNSNGRPRNGHAAPTHEIARLQEIPAILGLPPS